MSSLRVVVLCVLWCGLALSAQAEQNQIVAGAGPSTATAKAFFEAFATAPEADGYNFVVMEASVKHKGGIQNAEKFIFGRTGRPLTADEKALNKEEIFLAKVPIAFARGLEVDVNALSMAQIRDIYTGKITNWQQVGGPAAPILLVGREPGEALFQVLQEEYPWFKDVTFEKVFKKDHEVVTFLKSPYGRHAIAFGAQPNFSRHNLLEVTDLSAGVKLGLVYDLKNRNHPLVDAARRFAGSSAWKAQLPALEMLPVN